MKGVMRGCKWLIRDCPVSFEKRSLFDVRPAGHFRPFLILNDAVAERSQSSRLHQRCLSAQYFYVIDVIYQKTD